jgi:hypothetical protein
MHNKNIDEKFKNLIVTTFFEKQKYSMEIRCDFGCNITKNIYVIG